MNRPFNTFRNKRDQIIHKTAIIENNIEIVNWLKETVSLGLY